MAIESDMERSVEEGEVWRSPSNETQGSTIFDSWTVYSKISHNGPSEKWTTSVQRLILPQNTFQTS